MYGLQRLIHDTRSAKGLSQSALADLLGVSESSVCKWEDGSRVPRRDRLSQLAEALEWSPDQIQAAAVALLGLDAA